MKKLLVENMQRFRTKNMDSALDESKSADMYAAANMQLVKRNKQLKSLFESELIAMFMQLTGWEQQSLFDADALQQLNQKLLDEIEETPGSRPQSADYGINPRDTDAGRPSKGGWTGD
jgi:hypothetical protein